MKTYYLPDDLSSSVSGSEDEVIIRSYRSGHGALKNRIVLKRYMVNLLINGTKTVAYPESSASVAEGELVILSTGNILTSEILSRQEAFTSIVLYFSDDVLNRFLIKYEHLLQTSTSTLEKQPFLIYKQDVFLRQYILSLQILLGTSSDLPADLKQIKLEELLLYLLYFDARKLLLLQRDSGSQNKFELMKVVESHIGRPVTVDELAFLCNTSSSTFKRKFNHTYGTSPQQWLLTKKLLLAADLLKLNSEIPSQVYLKVGYHNHSSFSQAFRQHYGCTPSEYQKRYLNVLR